MAVFTAPAKNQRADQPRRTVKDEPQRERPDQIHGQPADQIVQEFAAHRVGNDHHREETTPAK